MLSRKQMQFQAGVSAASAFGVTTGLYPCPICGQQFDESALQSGQLTEEHVPPKSMGGASLLLTCKACNNYAGHAYEADLKKKELQRQQAFGIMGLKQGENGRVKLGAGGINVQAEMNVQDGTVNLEIGERNNPQNLQEIEAFFIAMTKGDSITLTSSHRYKPNNILRSMLKTAFLLLTAKFGYTFAFEPRMTQIRRHLLLDQEEEIPILTIEKAENLPDGHLIVCEDEGVAGVPFKQEILIVPWPSLPYTNFSKFSAIKPESLKGSLFPLPTEFEAMLDFLNLQQR